VNEIAITGLGVVLPGCHTIPTLWDQLRHGESQLRFEPDSEDASHTITTGRILDFLPEHHLECVPRRYYDLYDREVQIYLASVFSAIEHAGLNPSRWAPRRVGIFDGSSRPMFGSWHEKRLEEFRTSAAETYSRAD